jgi:processive 1,2-diacylglycerol beta-glucosyltransferase
MALGATLKRMRILLISASIGGGHQAAAKALEQACLQQNLTAKHIDLLDYTTSPFRQIYRQTYFDLVRTAPDFIDWLGKNLDKRPSEFKNRPQRVRARLSRLISYHLPREINRYKPDVILHTHFIAPEIISARRRRILKVPQMVVVTDFAAHNLWLQPNISRYFVASDEVSVHLQASGVEQSRIQVTGIPIDSRFKTLESKLQARAALGLSPERDVLLMMASGLDEKVFLSLLRQLQSLHYPLTAIFIFGRSQHLLELAESLQVPNTMVNFQYLGYSDQIPRYMAAADLVVGKPGGLTTSEALAAGLPFAVVNPYPLQEESNATYLLEHGVGFRIDPLTVFNYKIRNFFQDGTKRHDMHQRALSLAQPCAAQTIIQSVLENTSSQA